MGQKRLWALLIHFFYPLRQSRQGFASPSQALPRQLSQGESGHARKLYGSAGNCTAPLKPSPTRGRWRVAPDAGQHQLPRRGSQGLKPIAKVLGIMRRLSAVLLALPLRKDFHPLRGKMSRSAFKIIPHKKAAAHPPLCSSLKYFTFTTDQMLNCTAQKAA